MCFEMVGHQLFFKVLFTLSFPICRVANANGGVANSQQDIWQLLTCVLVEFKLTLNRDTVTEPRQI